MDGAKKTRKSGELFAKELYLKGKIKMRLPIYTE